MCNDLNIYLEVLRKTVKKTVRMAGAPSGIRKEHLSNTRLRSYRNTSPHLCALYYDHSPNSIHLLVSLPFPLR